MASDDMEMPQKKIRDNISMLIFASLYFILSFQDADNVKKIKKINLKKWPAWHRVLQDKKLHLVVLQLFVSNKYHYRINGLK
jgi:hypothetical protein